MSYQFKYANQADAVRKLRRLRGLWRAAPDHWAAEVPFLGLLALLLILVAVDRFHPLAFWLILIGYYGARLMDRRLTPAIRRRTCPAPLLRFPNSPATVTLAPEHVLVETEVSQLTLDWSALHVEPMGRHGVILRITPDQSLPLPANDLPPDTALKTFTETLQSWANRT